jgi:hypothetical protein
VIRRLAQCFFDNRVISAIGGKIAHASVQLCILNKAIATN